MDCRDVTHRRTDRKKKKTPQTKNPRLPSLFCAALILCGIFQRDETSNSSTPTKILPIDQIISHITNSGLERQQSPAQADHQVPSGDSTEASRRSSTSTQNTDTLTPTMPGDLADNHESVLSVVSAETILEVHHHQDELVEPPAAVASQTISSDMLKTDDASKNDSQEPREESREPPSDVQEPESKPSAPPARKISRFLVSPVVEQRNPSEAESSNADNSEQSGNAVTQDKATEMKITEQEAGDAKAVKEEIDNAQITQVGLSLFVFE